jgi:hypothetical protein
MSRNRPNSPTTSDTSIKNASSPATVMLWLACAAGESSLPMMLRTMEIPISRPPLSLLYHTSCLLLFRLWISCIILLNEVDEPSYDYQNTRADACDQCFPEAVMTLDCRDDHEPKTIQK